MDGIEAVETRSLGNTDYEDSEAKWGTARFGERMNLALHVRDTSALFVFDAATIDELIIGRYDHMSNTSPTIDLTDHAAADNGVSRRHAAIVLRDGALNIIDLGTVNGTFLNGQRLVPHQPRILRDGDDVRLGHLVLEVRFEHLRNTGN